MMMAHVYGLDADWLWPTGSPIKGNFVHQSTQGFFPFVRLHTTRVKAHVSSWVDARALWDMISCGHDQTSIARVAASVVLAVAASGGPLGCDRSAAEDGRQEKNQVVYSMR